jgi:hypothetical protein
MKLIETCWIQIEGLCNDYDVGNVVELIENATDDVNLFEDLFEYYYEQNRLTEDEVEEQVKLIMAVIL